MSGGENDYQGIEMEIISMPEDVITTSGMLTKFQEIEDGFRSQS